MTARRPTTAAVSDQPVRRRRGRPTDDSAATRADDGRRRGPRRPRAPDRADRPTSRREGDIAADYLEGLLDIADLDGDIDMDVEGDRAAGVRRRRRPRRPGRPHGEVLEALQELTRLAV